MKTENLRKWGQVTSLPFAFSPSCFSLSTLLLVLVMAAALWVGTAHAQTPEGSYDEDEAQAIDQMLDRAVSLASPEEQPDARQGEFVHRWAIGRALRESGLMESEHLDTEERKSLWLAIARKCRIGVRADGSREERWRSLIHQRTIDPTRIENDVFALGLWLQEQEIDQALNTFGAYHTNAINFHRRRSISSKKMRDALARWFMEMDPQRRAVLLRPSNFHTLTKALAKRFPARGPGSAKRPVHYTDDALYAEMLAVLEPLAEKLAPAASLATPPPPASPTVGAQQAL